MQNQSVWLWSDLGCGGGGDGDTWCDSPRMAFFSFLSKPDLAFICCERAYLSRMHSTCSQRITSKSIRYFMNYKD